MHTVLEGWASCFLLAFCVEYSESVIGKWGQKGTLVVECEGIRWLALSRRRIGEKRDT